MNAEDQVAEPKAGEQSLEKSPSLDEQFSRGWEQVEIATEQENAAKAKPKEEAKAAEKKEPGDSTSKPYKVLKVGGKEIPVATEEEFIALAQKGADYTKKTQALADDRRGAEAEVKKEEDRLAAASTRMETLLQKIIDKGYVPEKVGAAVKAKVAAAGEAVDDAGKVDEDDKAIYEEFQIDPANAYPHEKKTVKAIAEMRKELQQLRLERATETAEKAIAEERENFPYDDIKDDQGEDLTKKQLWALVVAKKQLSGIEKPDIKMITGWAREAVRDLHDKQRNGKPAEISDDMDLAEFIEFMKKFPKLAQTLKVTVGAKAIEENEAEKAKVPPSIKGATRPADLTRKPKADAGQRKSLDDYLDEGFKDPETIKALTGG
jgi:hypothetical protein